MRGFSIISLFVALNKLVRSSDSKEASVPNPSAPVAKEEDDSDLTQTQCDRSACHESQCKSINKSIAKPKVTVLKSTSDSIGGHRDESEESEDDAEEAEDIEKSCTEPAEKDSSK